MKDSIRAFLSIDIEDKSLLSRIEQIQRKLDLQAAKMKIVEMENIHFTLHFFGDTPLAKIDDVKKQLESLVFEPFDISITGVGAFPNRRRPRIVWIGVSEGSDQFKDLKKRIDTLLERMGIQTEKRKYTPHATIARVRHVKDSSLMTKNLEELVNESIGPMTVSGFTMKKSTLTPSGPIYDSLWRIP